MKADIPDKILINRGNDGKLHHSYWTTDQELVPFEDTIYIRKDALMEWLEERINDGDEEGLMTNQIANFAYKDVIDKINSL